MKYLVQLLSLSAICTIFYALFRVFILTRQIPGGIMKDYWKLFYYLIGLIAVGYLSTPLFPLLPQASKDLIIGIVFLAGAILVLKVIKLFFKIKETMGI